MPRTRAQDILQLQARSQRLRAKRRHKAVTTVVARLAPKMLHQLKAENRLDKKAAR